MGYTGVLGIARAMNSPFGGKLVAFGQVQEI